MRAYFFRRPSLQHEVARSHSTAGPVISVLLGLAVSLGGCAGSYQWVKDGFNAQHAEAQFASCQLEAERLRYISEESEDERAARIHHEAGLCMKADGWHWVQGDGSAASESASAEQEAKGRAPADALASGHSRDTAQAAEADKSASTPGAAADQTGGATAEPASGKKEEEEGGDDDEDEDEDE